MQTPRLPLLPFQLPGTLEQRRPFFLLVLRSVYDCNIANCSSSGEVGTPEVETILVYWSRHTKPGGENLLNRREILVAPFFRHDLRNPMFRSCEGIGDYVGSHSELRNGLE